MKELKEVRISIANSLESHFLTERIETPDGIILMEKNSEKKSHELACLALFTDKNVIVFRIGVLFFNFTIISGNKAELAGDYTFECLGQPGRLWME